MFVETRLYRKKTKHLGFSGSFDGLLYQMTKVVIVIVIRISPNLGTTKSRASPRNIGYTNHKSLFPAGPLLFYSNPIHEYALLSSLLCCISHAMPGSFLPKSFYHQTDCTAYYVSKRPCEKTLTLGILIVIVVVCGGPWLHIFEAGGFQECIDLIVVN